MSSVGRSRYVLVTLRSLTSHIWTTGSALIPSSLQRQHFNPLWTSTAHMHSNGEDGESPNKAEQGQRHRDAEKEPLPEWPDGMNPHTGEKGGPKGPEPTRYGDWERKGRVTDF